jgi:hypothetical protein
MGITLAQLDNYVGKRIADICGNGYSTPTQNHCAHFVSHALGLKLGVLCGDMAFKTRRTGASMRVDDLYNLLPFKGRWGERPAPANGVLIFVTSETNVVNGRMKNMPQKHVGIHFAGRVYNFSNTLHRVVMDPSVEHFHRKFSHTYAGGNIALYYGIPT